MPSLFHRAQVDVGVTFIRHLQAESIAVKRFGDGQILDVQTGVAQSNGVEVREQIRGWDRHARLLLIDKDGA